MLDENGHVALVRYACAQRQPCINSLQNGWKWKKQARYADQESLDISAMESSVECGNPSGA